VNGVKIVAERKVLEHDSMPLARRRLALQYG